MSKIWNPQTYDAARRRLVPCFDGFYGTAVELVVRTVRANPRILDLGAGTGLLSEMLARRSDPSAICLIDASKEMLARAEVRLSRWHPTTRVQDLNAALPAGPFDAVVSALAIHHLDDAGKKDLFERIFEVLAAGGIFVNAEQVQGTSEWEQNLFEATHLEAARALGSSSEEIAEAIQRMSHDRCTSLINQVCWLRELGYLRANSFFQWFRFAVFAGWK